MVKSSNMVPLIVSFFAGFIVNRLMNHQDVITGDVTEGFGWTWPQVLVLVAAPVVGVLVNGLLGWWVFCGIVSLLFLIEGLFNLKNGEGGISTDGWNMVRGSLISIGICSLLSVITLLKH